MNDGFERGCAKQTLKNSGINSSFIGSDKGTHKPKYANVVDPLGCSTPSAPSNRACCALTLLLPFNRQARIETAKRKHDLCSRRESGVTLEHLFECICDI